MRVGGHGFKRSSNTIGELNFTADTSRNRFEIIEYFRFKHITANHRQTRRRHGWLRLFHDTAKTRCSLSSVVHTHDAVLLGFFRRHILNGQNRPPALTSTRFDQLTNAGTASIDQIVSKNNAERRVLYNRPSAQHRMTEAERLRLTNVDAANTRRHDLTHDFKEFLLTLHFEFAFQFGVGIKMILNRPFVATGDENHFSNARSRSFLNSILNQGFVHDWQHFLRHCLSGGEKSRAETVDREYNFAYGLHGIEWDSQ